MKIINDRITLAKKLANWSNHRIFNIRCLRNNVFPPSVFSKPPDNSKRSYAAAFTASRTYLRQRIYSCLFHLEWIRTRIVALDNVIQQILPDHILVQIRDIIQSRYESTSRKTSKRQKRKFERLLQNLHRYKIYPKMNDSKVVINLSSRQLTKAESTLLQKGLNFNISRKPLKPEEVIPKIEPALEKLTDNNANKARLRIANILQHQRPSNCNLNPVELTALKSLKNYHSIQIMKADKGNITVVLNKEDYEKKALDHIQNGPYITIPSEKARTLLNKAKAEATKYVQSIKHKLDKNTWFHLNPKSNLPSRFYCLPKIHKEGVPIRPIVDYTTSPTYQLAKFLNRIIKQLQISVVRNIK
ncbi:MAG: hypothetical protein ACRCTW_06660, partial [Lactococcus garvieae]